MVYVFKVLKTSWGIRIDLDMEEEDCMGCEKYAKVAENVFLRLDGKQIENPETIFFWAEKAFSAIHQTVDANPAGKTCFVVKSIQFGYLDYQPEGLYYVFRGWLEEYYKMGKSNVNYYYDEKSNKYVFPDLS